MRWLDLRRLPEPEVMDDSGEVEAYSSAAALAYLSAIDDTFVDHVLRLLSGRASGKALDVGTGPGQMVRKMAKRLPGWSWTGVDRSPSMIRQAREDLAAGAEAASISDESHRGVNVEFFVADANQLPFTDRAFDLVTCNSVLHHLQNPKQLLAEIVRVASPNGAVLIRDLRRPKRFIYAAHVRWYGRHYSGLMYKLYCDSVRSAYTREELSELANTLPAAGLRVFNRGQTHLGLERPAS